MKKNGELDFWKFIFAVLIVLFHSKNLTESGGSLFIGGSIGVEFFFVTSGLLMAATSEKTGPTQLSLGKDTFAFMKHKIKGLLPNLYVAWVIGFIVEHSVNLSPAKMVKDAAGSVWELTFLTETGLLGYRANAVAWYISAMLIAMLIIWPLLRKLDDTWYYILAPLVVIFIAGITYQSWESMRAPHIWRGFAFKSLIRAVLGISLGTLCYKAAAWLREKEMTRGWRVLLSVAVFALFGAVLFWSMDHSGSKWDWHLLLMLAVGLTLVFSGAGAAAPFFGRHAVFSKLGTFSYSLFLGHGYWSHVVSSYFPELTYGQRLLIYLALSVCTAILIMKISDLIRSRRQRLQAAG